jgi:NAD(P)-dependent dehydrogenase (short-subunit alcohol dehydrogenase family)
MEKKKIILWQPTKQLFANAEKLDFTNEIIGQVWEKEDSTENQEYANLAAGTLSEGAFDYVLIPYENFRQSRSILTETYKVDPAKIYTFEEFWVKDCEKQITETYYAKWKSVHDSRVRDFEDCNIVITGGGSGIGKECAHAFLSYGANVVILGRNRDKLEAVCKQYQELGNIQFMQWDISEIAQYDAKMTELLKLLDGRVDVLVNSAGILDAIEKNFFDVTEPEFDSVINVNLKSTYFMCQLFAKYFRKQRKKGHIVNVASKTGILPSVKPYGISKWGIVGLTKGLGKNLAEYGIIVNGVAPGEVATPLLNWEEGVCPARRANKIGRVTFPCEIAQIILHLAGCIGEKLIGEVIDCSGADTAISLYL